MRHIFSKNWKWLGWSSELVHSNLTTIVTSVAKSLHNVCCIGLTQYSLSRASGKPSCSNIIMCDMVFPALACTNGLLNIDNSQKLTMTLTLLRSLQDSISEQRCINYSVQWPFCVRHHSALAASAQAGMIKTVATVICTAIAHHI